MYNYVHLARAVAIAAHSGQLDKAGAPYIGHPSRVASNFTDPSLKAISWLHDVLEDTSLTYEDLLDIGIKEEDCIAIDVLTRYEGQTPEQYYALVKNNPLALEVKLADIADNTNRARMNLLDRPTQKRLTRKYKYALECLL